MLFSASAARIAGQKEKAEAQVLKYHVEEVRDTSQLSGKAIGGRLVSCHNPLSQDFL